MAAEFMLKMDQELLPERFVTFDKEHLTPEQLDFIYEQLGKHIYAFEKAYKFRRDDSRELHEIPDSEERPTDTWSPLSEQPGERDDSGYYRDLIGACEGILNPEGNKEGGQQFEAFVLFLRGAPATIIANKLKCTPREAQELVNGALDTIGKRLGTATDIFKLKTETNSPALEGLGRILNKQEVTIDLTKPIDRIAEELKVSRGFAARLKQQARKNILVDGGTTGTARFIPNFHQADPVKADISYATRPTKELQEEFGLTHDQARRLREKSMALAGIEKRDKNTYTPKHNPNTGRIQSDNEKRARE